MEKLPLPSTSRIRFFSAFKAWAMLKAHHEVPIRSAPDISTDKFPVSYTHLKTSYQKAAETFDKVEMEHPYSKWATKSKMMSAYSYYKDEKYDDAIAALDRYIRLHPGTKDVAYAFYLKGVC